MKKYLALAALVGALTATQVWADTKISQMASGGNLQAGDVLPGLRGGQNFQFTYSPSAAGVATFSGDGVFYNNAASTGAVTLSLANQLANCILAGPTTGSPATPTCRALVTGDLPTITTLGTIVTGVWNGTTIGTGYGGTGVSNPTAHSLLIGAGSSPVTALAPSTTANWVLTSTTSSVDPSWQPPSSSGSASIIATSLYTTDTGGNLYPNVYTGSGGNASSHEAGWALAATMTTAAADPVLELRFAMPSVVPSGALKFMSTCLAAAGSGAVKYTLSDANVATGSSPSAASLSAESQTTLSFTTTDGYLQTKTALTSVPTVNGTSVVALTFNRTGTTIGTAPTCRFSEIFE